MELKSIVKYAVEKVICSTLLKPNSQKVKTAKHSQRTRQSRRIRSVEHHVLLA